MINRATLLVCLLLLGAALLLPGSVRKQSLPVAPARPDIVIIDIDTLRAQALACYGNPVEYAPGLSDLAAVSTTFLRAYTPFPHTIPAHASLMTGQHPRTTGVRGMVALADSFPTLAATLQQHGYATAAFVSGWTVHRTYGLSRGFQHYDDTLPYEGFRRDGEQTVAALARWLTRTPPPGDQPLFLWIHLFDMHAPYNFTVTSEQQFTAYTSGNPASFPVPGKFVPPYLADWLRQFPSLPAATAEYGHALRRVDQLVTAIRAQLAEKRQRPLALIFLADHGEGLGENDYYFDHGERVDEVELHIPLIINYPPLFPPGRRIADPVRLFDVFPTISALAGCPADDGQRDGRPLQPLLAARVVPLPPRLVFSEGGPYRPGMCYPTDLRGEASRPHAIIRGPLKLVHYAGRNETLYDVLADPDELHDLLAARPAETAQLRALRGIISSAISASPSAPADSADVARRLRGLGYLQ